MRRSVSALLVGLVLGLASPVLADHVVEPTAPILDTDLRLYDYGTTNRAPCGGSFDFDRVYYDLFVTVAGLPSEHWDVRFAHQFGEVASNPAKADWYDWGHQNAPPHPHNDTLRFKAAHGEIAAPDSGPLTFLVEVTGLESGVVLTESCTIWREG